MGHDLKSYSPLFQGRRPHGAEMVARSLDPAIHLQLALQTALLENIPPNLYAVTAGLRGNDVIIVGYYSNHPTESDVEYLQVTSRELASYVPWDAIVDEYVYCIQEHKPEVLDFWGFIRAPGLGPYL